MIRYGQQDITQSDIDAVIGVLKSINLTQGPNITQFEQSVTAHTGAKHAVAVNSATSALHIACIALDLGPGDLLWMRQLDPDKAASAINRDCLVPRPGGRFAFGRLIDRRGTLVGLLPPGAGQKQVVVENPAWIAVATMLVRSL